MEKYTRPLSRHHFMCTQLNQQPRKMEVAHFSTWLRPIKEKPPENHTRLNGAERSQRWRDNLKANPKEYKHFKTVDALRNKLSRKKPLSDEQKEEMRARNRERQRKFREQRKSLGQETKTEPKRKILTRKEKEKQRDYWKEKQRESRAKRSSQKTRRKKEKDRAYVKNKRNTTKEEQCGTESTMSQSAVRKAIQRAKLPNKPGNFAEAVQYMIRASPNKRLALEERGIIATKTDKCNNKIIQILKDKLKNKKVKASLFPALKVMKKYKMLKTTSFNLGVHPSSLSRFTEEPRKSRLDENAEKEIHNFFDNISTSVPDRKSVKRKETEGRKILDRPLKSVFVDYKESGGSLGFSTFAKKVPRNIQTCNKQTWYSCLCEYCTNVDLKIKALNDFANKAHMPECKLNDRYHAVNVTLCDKEEASPFHSKKCVERQCEHCSKDLLVSHLEPILKEHGHDSVEYTVWEKQDGELNKKGKISVRVMMVKKRESLNAIVIKLADHIDMLANHLFVARWQQKQFTQLISNIPEDWVVLNLDFAENYSCISQMEIQTAHWGHTQATVHPIVGYYNCNKDGCEKTDPVQETMLFVSNDLLHDNNAVNCFITKANEHLQTIRSLNIVKEVQFSDGCAGQYKACVPFCDISHSVQDFGFITERNYYGSRHGKGPSDGAGAVIKSAARRAVNSQQEVINNAKDLADFAQRSLRKDDEPQTHTHRKRTIFYVPSVDINRNRPDRKAKTVAGTRKLHCVRSVEQPHHLLTRHLSCFCAHCKSPSEQGECANTKFVDPFTEIELRQPQEAGARGRQPQEAGARGRQPHEAGARGRQPQEAGARGRRGRGRQPRGRQPHEAGARGRQPQEAGARGRQGRGRQPRGRQPRGARTRGGRGQDLTRGERGIEMDRQPRGARTRGGRGQGLTRDGIIIEADRQNRGRQPRGLRTRGGRGQVMTRGGRRKPTQYISSSEDEDSLGSTTGTESPEEEEFSIGSITGADSPEDQEFDIGNSTRAGSPKEESDLGSNTSLEEEFGNISGLSTVLLSFEEDMVLGSGPGSLFPALCSELTAEPVFQATVEPDPHPVEEHPHRLPEEIKQTSLGDSTKWAAQEDPAPQQLVEPAPQSTEEYVPQPMEEHVPQPTEEQLPQPTEEQVPKPTEEQVHQVTEEPDPHPVEEHPHRLPEEIKQTSLRDSTKWAAQEDPAPQQLVEPAPQSTEEYVPQPMEEHVPQPTEEQLPQPTEEQVLKPTEEQVHQVTEEPDPHPVEEHPHRLPEEIKQTSLRDSTKWAAQEDPAPQQLVEPAPQPTEEYVPQPTEEHVPQPTEEHVPQPTEEQLPQPTEEQVPQPTEEQVPQPTEVPALKHLDEPSCSPVRKSYQDGTYIKVQHGTEIYPAVVDQWPWISYFKPVRGRGNHWQLQETRHTVIYEDVVGVIPSPDLAMSGPRRFFYVFKDL